jgi:hypothetical protein
MRHLGGDVKPEDLVAEYWEFWPLFRGNREERLAAEHGAADDAVREAIGVGDPSVVSLLVALAEGAPSDDDAGLLGAGPVEDLLTLHGPRMAQPEGKELLDEVDSAARRSPRFRLALKSVSMGDQIPTKVQEQLLRF